MYEPFSFGAPERRRFAVQFGYDMRPSFWQGLQSNAHLVIAAVGTAALLGVAAVALWLALPANERQAIASAEQTVPAMPVKTKKIAPAAASAISVAAPQAARKADAVSPVTAAREATIPALASNNPRWNGTGGEPAPAAADAPPASSAQAADKPATQSDKPAVAAFAESAPANDASSALSKVAAPAATNDPPTTEKKADDKMDGSQTAAISATKPQALDDQTAATEDQAKPDPEKVSAVANGRILRAVTMRAGPKQKAAAMLTVPAKTSVQVLSCKKWCEIVYNGKRGWIYKSYVKTGA